MGRARFIIYPWFNFFFFVVLSATRPRLPLGHTEDRRESRNLTCLLAKSCSDVTTRTMLWICNIYFLFFVFVFIRFEFKENSKYTKKVLSQP